MKFEVGDRVYIPWNYLWKGNFGVVLEQTWETKWMTPCFKVQLDNGKTALFYGNELRNENYATKKS